MERDRSDRVVAFITCEKLEEAERIAGELLRRRKAACVSIYPRGTSYFWWKGAIDTAREHLLIAKTTSALMDDFIRVVKENHSYEVPEIISIPITGGSRDYLEWLDRELQ